MVLAWRDEAGEYTRIADRVVDVLMNGFGGAESSSWATQRELQWTLATGNSKTADSFWRAATLLVNEQGYRGASVDKISAKLTFTKDFFYHHNGNKQDLDCRLLISRAPQVGVILGEASDPERLPPLAAMNAALLLLRSGYPPSQRVRRHIGWPR